MNITKAANDLNYVQSNITTRLNKIEKEVDSTLLIRTNKGVQLTSEGEQFLEFVDKMIQLHREMIDTMKFSNTPSGQLNIGADITTAARLPRVLTTFVESYPMVEFSLINGSSKELIRDVLKFNIDGSFITDTIDQPKLLQEKLIIEELVLISNIDHPPIQNLKDLKKNTILVFKNGCIYRHKLEDWIVKEGTMVRKVELGTIKSMIDCVKSGLGVALVSKLMAEKLNSDKRLQLHTVPEDYRYVTTVFIRRKDIPMTNALQKFFEISKRSFSENSNNLVHDSCLAKIK